MNPANMAFFTEDSDEDSIKTDTTAESVHSNDEDFNVEQILAEWTEVNEPTLYLVKWEGYPLHRCTWEPDGMFGSREPLDAWEAKKREAANGGEPLFDLDEYHYAYECEEDEKKKKHLRRVAKRRKRGEVVSRSQTRSLSSRSQSPAVPATAAVAMSARSTRSSVASPVKKKGIAQKVLKSPPEDRPKPGRMAESSLAKRPASAAKTTAKPAPPAPVPAPVPAPAPAPATRPTAKATQPAPKPSGPARKTAPAAPQISFDPAPPKPKKARAPSDKQFRTLAEQNRYNNYRRQEPAPDPNALVLLDPRTGKPVPRDPALSTVAGPLDESAAPVTPMGSVSEDHVAQHSTTGVPTVRTGGDQTAKEPTVALPEQNKQAAQKPQPRVSIAEPGASTSLPSGIASAYGRRSPPREARPRSPSPPIQTSAAQNTAPVSELPPNHPRRMVCKHWQTGSCRFTSENCRYAHSYPTDPKTQLTCHFWATGRRCRKSAEQCEFAHFDTGVRAPDLRDARQYTCFFWFNGNNCNKNAEQCKYAHYSTGIVAPAPVGYVPKTPLTATDSSSVPMAAFGNMPAAVPPTQGSYTVPTFQPQAAPQAPMAREPEPLIEPMVMEDDLPDLDGQGASTGEDFDMQDSWRTSTPAEDLAIAQASIDGLQDTARFLSRNGKPIEHVYISMPSEREGEKKLMEEYFRRTFNCKIFHNGIAQHWNYFRNTFTQGETPSLVVIHPSETFDGTLPGLADFILRQKGWVFSFGVHDDWVAIDGCSRKYDARRVFPHAGITLITDDVFVYYPEKATEIIEEFLARARNKPAGGELSKIGARPGIRDWLANLAAKKADEGGPSHADDRYLKCWNAICELCPLEDYDPYEMAVGRMEPKEDAYLWSLAEQDFPSFQGLWEMDEMQATDTMVNLFAGTGVERMWEFQRFWIVYQRPDQMEQSNEIPASQLAPQVVEKQVDPHGWMKEYNHLEVMTPEGYMAHMRRRG